MTDTVTVPDGKTTLDELLARVEAGEEVVISRGGAPVARLVPVVPVAPVRETAHPAAGLEHPTPTRPRQFGLYAGLADLGPGFFEPLPEEELRLWEGGVERVW